MVAATGTGKSNLIAMAPFAGARDRCLVLVPNLTILEGLRKTLGGPPPQGEEEAEETVPPALRSSSCSATTPRCRACSSSTT